MQTKDITNIHRFLDYDEGTGIVNQFYRIFSEDQDEAREFLKTHSKLSDEKINQAFALMNGDDAEEEQDSLGILISKEAEFHRTTEETIEAYNQAWDRRWYGRSPREVRLSFAKSPEMLTQIAAALDEREAIFDDIQDDKYYDQYGWGYLAGIQSALAWVLGDHWMMLDT